MIDFDNKLKNLKKKVTSNKTKYLEAKKEITDLTKNVTQISEKGYVFLLNRMYFPGGDGYQIFKSFAPMLNSLTLDNNKKVAGIEQNII